jgi:S1-C subfamily serine protease
VLDVTLTKLHVRGKKVVTDPGASWRGMRVDYVSAVLEPFSRESLAGLSFDDGVVVIDVNEESRSWEAGLRPGMLVSHVGQREIHNPEEFRKAVSGRTGAVQLRLADLDGQTPPQAIVRGS